MPALAGAVDQGARWNATTQAAIAAIVAAAIVACAICLFVLVVRRRRQRKPDCRLLLRHPKFAAVSLNQVFLFRAQVKNELGSVYRTATSYTINERIIRPFCEVHKESYAVHVNKGSLLHAEVFVSHAWSENFDTFVDSIATSLARMPWKPNLWICFLALVQTGGPSLSPVYFDTTSIPIGAPFMQALAEAWQVLVVRNSTCNIYSRIWCCWELYLAFEQGIVNKTGRIIVAGPDTFTDTKASDIGNAEASNQEDTVTILDHIVQHGGCSKVNEVLDQLRAMESVSPAMSSSHERLASERLSVESI